MGQNPVPPPALDRASLVSTTEPGTKDVENIRWNLPYEPMSLDPMQSFNYAENTALANMCESLTRLNPDLSTSPGLAQKVEFPDDKTVVFTLRQGVKFWNGNEMKASDVAFSINRQAGPDSPSFFSDYFLNVDKAEVTGDYEVTVKLLRPDALFAQGMASAAGAIVEEKSAKASGEKFGTPQGELQCTGPYQLSKWSSGKSMQLKSFDGYWDQTLPRHVKNLEFSFIADESTAVNALRSGSVDGQYFYLPPAGMEQLKNSDEVDVSYGKSLVFFTLRAASTEGPFADPKVRKALSLVMDRDAMSRVILQGAAIGSGTMASSDYWGGQKDIFAAAEDPNADELNIEKAKKLVAEHGEFDRPIVIALQGSSAVHEQLANVIQAAGKSIGIPIETQVIPVEQFGNIYFDPAAREGLDAFFTSYYGNVPDPLDVYQVFRLSNSSNFGEWDSADKLLNQAMGTMDPEQRAKLTVQAQDLVQEEQPWITISYLPNILVQNSKISGATASFSYLYYPWAATIGGK
ncbi:ABC transporter substrate-binding protein [Glutamicibacter sp.]|uniref:ABC transporter substrate-binding protein n=1 Tax=Glutamicibacter sp. TaxID=1931995 RepID=UPI0028BEA606|nr:ABC transporter substrate-binding protein [Glutamicibacter sp.]